MQIEPFRIHVPDVEIDDLRARLGETRWPDAIEGSGWAYGVDDAYVRQLVGDWRTFDWRAAEASLNTYPQFITKVGGQDIHFVHVRGKGPNPRPLILTHGFPSTWVEWLRTVALLTDPEAHGGEAADAFDVVIPSLPGHGFSCIPREPGMDPRRIAALWAELMSGLGYERFGACGTDWGSTISSYLGLDFPERLTGIHLGAPILTPPRDRDAPKPEAQRAFERKIVLWMKREYGYVAIQSTKPQVLAYGLNDSPAGLAAWIAEKMRLWSDHNGDPAEAIPRETLLTIISTYWFTGTINSAMRLYQENDWDFKLVPGQRVEAPTAFLVERADHPPAGLVDLTQATPRAGQQPRETAELAYNVKRYAVAPKGGHFPGIETPELIVEDLRAFFRDPEVRA